MLSNISQVQGIIIEGLEKECAQALNATPPGRPIRLAYYPDSSECFLVGGKPSTALKVLAQWLGVDGMFDWLASWGRAVTTYREGHTHPDFQ